MVWNYFAPKLWDRTLTLLRRNLGESVKIRYAKVAEFQRRGAVHLHAVVRLDGYDPADPQAVLTPPEWVTVEDLTAAIGHAAAAAGLRTPAHSDRPEGWPLVWGDQGKGTFADVRVIRRGVPGAAVTEQHVAGYLAKYATKGAEAAGTHSARLTDESIGDYADFNGTHAARLLAACWHLGRPTGMSQPLANRPRAARSATELRQPWTCDTCGHTTRLAVCLPCEAHAALEQDEEEDAHDQAVAPELVSRPANPFAGLRRWAHMLGFGGHFSTKSRLYSTTLRQLRADRATHATAEANPTVVDPGQLTERDDQETTLVVRRWKVVGFGWKTPADAALAGLSADAARQRRIANSPAV